MISYGKENRKKDFSKTAPPKHGSGGSANT